MPTITGFLEHLAWQFEDSNTMFLIVIATVYLLLSLWENQTIAYMECLTIYVGVFLAAFITAFCAHTKDKQFLKIKDEINKEMVVVYRGQYGTTTSVPVRELVVGDVIHVEQGDRVPADCILVEEMNITVDETMYHFTQSCVEKSESKCYSVSEENVGDAQKPADNHVQNPDPFLLTGSLVLSGQGRAVVCAVGDNTRLSRSRKQGDLEIKEQQTFLEEKLDETASQISKYATIMAFLIVFTQAVYALILLLFSEKFSLLSGVTLVQLSRVAIIGVCILIVAIPEGLPIAVSIAMALSVSKLKEDQILIKNLEAVQTCSMLHDICIGKTGTITEAKMSVARFHICDYATVEENEGDSFTQKLEVQGELKDLIQEVIIANTNVRFEANDDTMQYEARGQELEIGMINFLLDNKIDAQQMLIDRNLYAKKVFLLPFNQKDKLMVVARQMANDESQVRIYVKGAPESIIPHCVDTFNEQFHLKEFDSGEQVEILTTNVSSQMAK